MKNARANPRVFIAVLITLLMVSSLSLAFAAAPGKPGGTVTVAMWGEMKSLDPHVDPFDKTMLVASHVFDHLIAKDPKNGSFKPYLAASWSVSKDGLVWTFNLRRDVKFSDGTPLNAEAVKYSLDRIMDPKTESKKSATMMGPLTKVEATGPYTVRLTFSTPWAPLTDSLSQGYTSIVSPAAAEKWGLEQFQNHLVGSGPFLFGERVVRDHITVNRNPAYNWAPSIRHHQGAAYLDRVVFKWVEEDSTRCQVLKNAEVDVVQEMPAQCVKQYRGDNQYTVMTDVPPGVPTLFVLNTSRPPLDDVRVRRALIYATNPEGITQALYQGEYPVAHGPLISTTPCYSAAATKLYPTNLAKARELLDSAGWKLNASTGVREKNGKPLELDQVNIAGAEMGQVVQAQLAQVGARVKVELVTGPIQLDRAAQGSFDLMWERYRYSDPGVLQLLFASENNKPGGWSWSRYKNAKLDDLLDKSVTAVNDADRCRVLAQAQAIIMRDAIVIPILTQPIITVVRNNIKDWYFEARAYYFNAYDVWREK